MIEFRHILWPIDFSGTSARALTYATAFAAWYEAQLTVLHVAPTFDERLEPVPVGDVKRARRRAPTIRQALLNIPQSVGLFPASGDRRTVSFRKRDEFGARTARTSNRGEVTCLRARVRELPIRLRPFSRA